jgi:ribokinase
MTSNGPQLTIIGDIGVDLVMGPLASWPRVGTETIMDRSELRAGGSAGNAALAVHYLGGRSRLISAVGGDEFGAWLRGQLAAIETALQPCDQPTTVTVGLLHSCGDRTFFTTRGHLEHLSPEFVRSQLGRAAPGAVALLAGPFLTPSLRASYPRLIEELREHGYEVALDTGWPPGAWDNALRSEVRGWIGACSHVLINEVEAMSLAGLDSLEESVATLASWLLPSATLVVKTGAKGAVAVQDGVHAQRGAADADVFDTVGAGDSFNAGYLMARMRGAVLSDAIAAGCAAATSIIARFPRRAIGAGELAASLDVQRLAGEAA